MDGVAQPTALTEVMATAARFLAELDKTWSVCRLYGTAHPTFRRGAEAAAASVDRRLQLSVSPKGFSVDRVQLPDEQLVKIAQRLRRLGLVGLTVEAGVTADDVVALVLAIHETNSARVNGEAFARSIASATDRRVNPVTIRISDLNLVAGTTPATPDTEPGELWQELFDRACFGPAGAASSTAPTEAARAFEAVLRDVHSPAHWDSMVGVWIKELSNLDLQADGPTAGGRADATSAPSATRLEAVTTFLKALSPTLSQRLIRETIASPSAPEPVVRALAERLPTGVVLGALSAVDRTGAAPSSAALSLLRAVASHVTGASPTAPQPRTNAELAEIGSSLERLLKAADESRFVPADYLRRRDELSRGNVAAPPAPPLLTCPTEAATRRHAAAIVLGMLASPDAEAAHLVSCLEYCRQRTGQWLRAGEFALAGRAAELAPALCQHADPAVAAAARALLDDGCGADELIEGCRHHQDGAATVTELAELLRRDDGSVLVRVLQSPAFTGRDPADKSLVEAIRQVLPGASGDCFRILLGAAKGEPPPALLAVLGSVPGAEAIGVVEAMLPHAPPGGRYAIVKALFNRNLPWPLALTERLLKDAEPGVRRLAVMRLVRDAGPATAAGHLRVAAGSDVFPPDVAVGLAELLRTQRSHPDVRAAYRQWFWSRRRWAGLLSISADNGRRAG